tara:strand:- start:653 stop:2680 length:2028 start_codon:yes stop_codon:yes gene_type:complete
MTTISFAAQTPFARSKSNSTSSSFERRRRTCVVVKSATRSKRSDENDDFSPSITTSPLREEDDDNKNKEEIETYHLQGVSSGGKSLIVFLSWCAFAEKTGILEPIFVSNSSLEKEEKKTSKKEQKTTQSLRWKDRAKREFSKNTPFGESENFPLKLSFQRGKTYFTEKRFKKSISDGTETKFDAKGEKLKAELQKRKNVEILKRELLQKKMEEAKEVERERAKTQKEAEMKAQKVKEELELKAKMKIDAERKKQEQKEKAKQQMMMQEQQQQQQKAMMDAKKNNFKNENEKQKKKKAKATTTSSATTSKRTIQMPKVTLPDMTQTKESLSKSASSFAEFSKSVSSSALETSKSIGSSVADVSVKAKDATVSSVKKTVSTASNVATKTKDSLLSIELPKRKEKIIENTTTKKNNKKIQQRQQQQPKKVASSAAAKREEKKKKSVEKLKPIQQQKKAILTSKKMEKTKTTKATKSSAAGSTLATKISPSSFSSLAKQSRTLIGDKVTSAVQFATTNIRPPSIATVPTNLSPAAIQQTALYVSSFLLLAFTSSRVRKNRRERAQKRAEREIRLAADRERQKQRWTKAIAQNPDSSQLLGNRTSKTAKTITKSDTSKRLSSASQDDEFDEVREMNASLKKASSNNESGWDEKEYDKMNKEYQKFLKDSRLPKERKGNTK